MGFLDSCQERKRRVSPKRKTEFLGDITRETRVPLSRVPPTNDGKRIGEQGKGYPARR